MVTVRISARFVAHLKPGLTLKTCFHVTHINAFQLMSNTSALLQAARGCAGERKGRMGGLGVVGVVGSCCGGLHLTAWFFPGRNPKSKLFLSTGGTPTATLALVEEGHMYCTHAGGLWEERMPLAVNLPDFY